MFISAYTKRELKLCEAGYYGSYSNLADAFKACGNDGGCAAIYDRGCDDTGTFSLCPAGYTEKVSGSSCLYVKGIL